MQAIDNLRDFGLAPWALIVAAPFVGSFLGVLIRRLPEGRPVVWSRSVCEHCGTVLRPAELAPLLGWALARGRCRHCGRALGWFYPTVELAAVAVVLIALAADDIGPVWLDCLLGWWLLALAWIDLRRWVLPDALTLPLIVAGLLAALALDPDDLVARALGAALGYLVLRLVGSVYLRLRGREGLGQGDAKLFAAAGAWLGALALPQVILVAAVVALAAAAGLRLVGARIGAQTALPFGPFLALAIWALWLFGPLPL
jgi:leader peptidase (prepilin peptidase) / N-methyltransferase